MLSACKVSMTRILIPEKPMKSYIILFACLMPLAPFARAEESKPDLSELLIEDESGEYKGLTDEGLAYFKKQRDVFRERERLFNEKFKNMGNVHHALTLTRLAEANMFLYGPPRWRQISCCQLVTFRGG